MSLQVTSASGVLAALAIIAALFFWLEHRTKWRLFGILPPLIWIYSVPLVLRNVGVLPAESTVYGGLRSIGLPMIIVLLLLSIDIGAAIRVMGRGMGVMLFGTAGIVLGAPVGYFVVHRWLDPDAWKGFGALAGSWIGGTGNLAAVAGALDTPPSQFGLAVLADNVIYVVWLPLLLMSKALAPRFNRWARVSETRMTRMDAQAALEEKSTEAPDMRHYLYLIALAGGSTQIAAFVAPLLPELGPVISTATWNILLVTTLGIALSFTKARRIPGSHNFAMALLYLFVARMGATASLEGLAQAPAFLLGCAIWICVHGLFCIGGAYLLKVDIHSAAIASAANVGGPASAPIVAAHHRESLVPASILMALVGYALGNYMALIAASLCRWVGTF